MVYRLLLGVFVCLMWVADPARQAVALPQSSGPLRQQSEIPKPPERPAAPHSLSPVILQQTSQSLLPESAPQTKVATSQSEISLSRAPAQSPLRRSTGNLKSVCFLDSKTGVAVGTGGSIWRTTDGGNSWNASRSPVTADLEAVVFDGEGRGWAVGGTTLPVNGVHQGVVLASTDRGTTWKTIDTVLLPRLTDVSISQSGRLYATAYPSRQYPMRLFESRDAGNSWNAVEYSVPARKTATAEESRRQFWQHPSHGWMEDDRAVVSLESGTIAVRDGQGLWSEFEGLPAEQSPVLTSIAKQNGRLIAVDHRGGAWVSVNQGDRWVPLATVLPPSTLSANTAFRKVCQAGADCWLVGRDDGQALHLVGSEAKWRRFPLGYRVQDLCFFQSSGWAVGPLGQIAVTSNGGQDWQPQYAVHPKLAVLVIADSFADIPPALLTQLSGNNQLNVGVVVRDSTVPMHVAQSISSQNEICWLEVCPEAFDVHQPEQIRRTIDSLLRSLHPQILLMCPGKRAGLPVSDWISTAQAMRSESEDSGDLWGVAGQTVQYAENARGASVGMNAYSHQLQCELADGAFPGEVLLRAWAKEANSDSPKVLGIHLIATAGNRDLSWFGGLNLATANSAMTQLSRKLPSGSPDALFDLAQKIDFKRNWMTEYSVASTHRPELRTEWLNSVLASLSRVPAKSQQLWLIQLGEECARLGDYRKAALVWWEAWSIDQQSPLGLYAICQALPLVISDEVQWKTRAEARQMAREEMLAAEERLQKALAEGQNTDEFQMDEALRRWGIDPLHKDQVPGEILERIQAMELVRRTAAESGEDEPTTLLEIPDFQARMQVSDPRSRKFGDKEGNSVTRNTGIVSWVPTKNAGAVAQANYASAESLSPGTVIDQLPQRRLLLAQQQARLAEGVWPHLQSTADWWLMKAHLYGALGEVSQMESAWQRAGNYLADRTDAEQWKQIVDFELRYGMGARLEPDGVQWLATPWADQRPVLDGYAGEEIWQHQVRNRANAGLGPGGRILLAHDEQFLYITIVVADAPADGLSNTPVNRVAGESKQPQRDQAARGNGIGLLLDTDRDYVHGFELWFDHDGNITDRQGNATAWDPLLFVSQQHQQGTWTIELALDLADVSLPKLGEFWHLELRDYRPAQPQKTSGWIRMQSLAIPSLPQ